MAFTVRVFGIFTNGAVGSENVQSRRARTLDDINRANQVWGSGFPGGARCEINFVLAGTYNFPDTTINGSTVGSVDDPQVENLIRQVRQDENDASAIYVVYVSGETLSNGVSTGNAGPATKFNDLTKLVGRAVITDRAANSFIFAHEAGHVLFGRFTSTGALTLDDPSSGKPHNDDENNIMFPIVPNENPLINTEQCTTARQSSVIVENS